MKFILQCLKIQILFRRNTLSLRCREKCLMLFMDIFFFFLVAPTLGSLLSLLEHRAEFPQFLDQGQSVGLLGRVVARPLVYGYTLHLF
jgi:hypothetical protein